MFVNYFSILLQDMNSVCMVNYAPLLKLFYLQHRCESIQFPNIDFKYLSLQKKNINNASRSNLLRLHY